MRNVVREPAVRRVEIPLERCPAALDGYRIVQLTDLHIGPILGRGFAAMLARRVEALAPDLVAVTGDMADGSARKLADEVAPLADLQAPDGVFFVTGNHELLSRAEPWVTQARQLGMRPLRNEHVAVRRDGAAFTLAGVNDHTGRLWGPSQAEDVPAALAGAPADLPVVLLAHDPNSFREARRLGVDLQISGHTHAGQLWPFRWLVRLVIRWVDGLHRDGPATIYVSRGTGFWGPPMRVGAPAEITEIVLRAAGPSAR